MGVRVGDIDADDCLIKIEINGVQTYSSGSSSCTVFSSKPNFNDMTANMGDQITFTLKDSGIAVLGLALCYIQGKIKIGEYLVSTENYQLWECTNCLYNIDGKKFKVENGNRLSCGNKGSSMNYIYIFTIPSTIEELSQVGKVDTSSKYYTLTSRTVYTQKNGNFEIDFSDINNGYWLWTGKKNVISTYDLFFKVVFSSTAKGKFYYLNKNGEKIYLNGNSGSINWFQGNLIYEGSSTEKNYMDSFTINTASYNTDESKRVSTSDSVKYNFCVIDDNCITLWETRISTYTSSCPSFSCDSCYFSCKTCDQTGTSVLHNCETCLVNYHYYFQYNKDGKSLLNCYNVTCDKSESEFLYHLYSNENECLKECPSSTYSIEGGYTCYPICNEGEGYLNNNRDSCVDLSGLNTFKSANDIYMYYTCYETCETCEINGENDELQNCNTCLSNFLYFFEYLQSNSLKKNCYNIPCESTLHKYHKVTNFYQCLNSCDEETYTISTDPYICFPKCHEGFGYLNDVHDYCHDLSELSSYSRSTTDQYMFYSCYNSCKTCKESSNDYKMQKCTTCQDNYPYFHEYINSIDGNKEKNCFKDSCNETKTDYLFHDKNNIYECLPSCTESAYYSLDNLYTCYSTCDYKNLLYDNCKLRVLNDTSFQEIKANVRDIIKYNCSSIKDQIYLDLEKGVSVQIISLDKQTFSEERTSILNFGDCEKILKDIYKIEEILLLEIELKFEQYSAPIIEYELYSPITKEKLDTSYCKDTDIYIEKQTKLDKEKLKLREQASSLGYDIFDPNSKFYNDICSTYVSEGGTDVLLRDRINDIYNNITLCEDGCQYESFNKDTLDVICKCSIKNEIINSIDDIKFSGQNIKNVLNNLGENSNIKIIKCYKLTFSKKGQAKNIGSYLMLIIILVYLILIGKYTYDKNKRIKICIAEIMENKIYHRLKNVKEINKIIKNDKKELKSERIRYQNKYNPIIKRKAAINENKRSIKNKTKIKNKSNPPPKYKKVNNKSLLVDSKTKFILGNNSKLNKINGNFIQNKKRGTNEVEIYSKKNKNPKVKVKPKNNQTKLIKNKDKNKGYATKLNIKNININLGSNIFKNAINNERINKNINLSMKNDLSNYKDNELNFMKYDKAIIIDNRTYFQYYWSLLKTKHLLIFSFIYNRKDYNLYVIKIALFIISFSMYLTVNALFFTDETMHNLYKDKGKINIIMQLPYLIISSVIPSIINVVLKQLSLSEKHLLKIKEENEIQRARIISIDIYNSLIKNFGIFFFISFLLITFFWYYIATFCAVYKNTQSALIKDTMVSFAMSMAYPFGLNLIPGFLRIPALRDKEKKKRCLYFISTLVSYI